MIKSIREKQSRIFNGILEQIDEKKRKDPDQKECAKKIVIEDVESFKLFQVKAPFEVRLESKVILFLKTVTRQLYKRVIKVLSSHTDKSDVHLKWHCDDQLSGFYSNEYEQQNEPGALKARLRIKHLYRSFNERSCSCYLLSISGQRLMHLQMFFQLHLAPVSVSIIRPSNESSLEQSLFSNRPSLVKSQRTLQLDAGQLLDLQCLASGSRPAANCKWSLLNGFQFKSKDYR